MSDYNNTHDGEDYFFGGIVELEMEGISQEVPVYATIAGCSTATMVTISCS